MHIAAQAVQRPVVFADELVAVIEEAGDHAVGGGGQEPPHRVIGQAQGIGWPASVLATWTRRFSPSRTRARTHMSKIRRKAVGLRRFVGRCPSGVSVNNERKHQRAPYLIIFCRYRNATLGEIKSTLLLKLG